MLLDAAGADAAAARGAGAEPADLGGAAWACHPTERLPTKARVFNKAAMRRRGDSVDANSPGFMGCSVSIKVFKEAVKWLHHRKVV